MKTIRKYLSSVSIPLAAVMLLEIFLPNTALALSEGPSAPEANSFSPVGGDMVDPFTGDFSYSIPLGQIGSFPLNLSYSPPVGMEGEASWVGLGWNLGIGSISRELRGLPDDFDGDVVQYENTRNANKNYEVSLAAALEFAGKKQKLKSVGQYNFIPTLNFNLKLTYDNFSGFGIGSGMGFDAKFSKKDSSRSFGAGFSGSLDSREGAGFETHFSYTKAGDVINQSINGSVAMNTRRGLYSYGLGYTAKMNYGTAKRSASFLSMKQPAYTPMPKVQYKRNIVHLGFGLGFEGSYINVSPRIAMRVATTKIAENKTSVKAFGYMNLQNASVHDQLDFNRDREITIMQSTPDLPGSYLTYDQFQVSTWGMSGSFRSYRKDVGTVYDPQSGVQSVADLGLDAHFGFGAAATKVGIDPTATFNFERNGKKSGQSFKKADDVSYFKMMNEISGTDPLYEQMGPNPQKLNVNNSDDPSATAFTAYTLTNAKVKRNTTIVSLTANQANKFSTTANLQSYKKNTFEKGNNGMLKPETIISRTAEFRKGHHINEIQMINSSGQRFVFGLPVYNIYQKEVSFSVENNHVIDGKYVEFQSIDASLENNKGKEKFFSSTLTPAYASSYLVTAILSPDYSDLRGDGITPDDFGDAIKFNYTKTEDYDWRTPHEKANFQNGLISKSDDNKGHYSCGKRENWYVHSIETKNQIALFHISPRYDNPSIAENGDRTFQSYKLDKIEIFSRQEYHETNNPKPLKTIHFEYTYDLCKNTPTNIPNHPPIDPNPNNLQFGKLTLKRVYFTYNGSTKGEKNAYEFEYNAVDYSSNQNRWGVKQESAIFNQTLLTEVPYVMQDQTTANPNVQANFLTTINLPSGGKIQVEYESDEYAYVQNKKAMYMTNIEGIGKDVNFDINNRNNNLYNGVGDKSLRYLYFSKKNGINSTLASALAHHPGDQLYFKLHAKLTPNPNSNDFEWFEGWGEVEEVGNCPINSNNPNDNYGYVKLKEVSISSTRKESPLTYAVIFQLKSHSPEVVYGGDFNHGNGALEVAKSMVAMLQSFLEVFTGPIKSLKTNKFGQTIDLNKSFIRLTEPSGHKLGGGYRVKKLIVQDNWRDMVGSDEASASYTKVYNYDLPDGTSSGVAAYEPQAGNEESPMTYPKVYDKFHALGPRDIEYIQTPILESVYPGPTVGYSRVEIVTLDPQNTNPDGKTVLEFYTAKDFPVISKSSPIQLYIPRVKTTNNVIGTNSLTVLNAAQSHSVFVNDMHGKPKSQKEFGKKTDPTQPDVPISGSEYIYHTTSENTLNNKVPTFTKDAKLIENTIGVTLDYAFDSRNYYSVTNTAALAFNNDIQVYPAGPLPIFPIWPEMGKSTVSQTVTVESRIINQRGILKEVKTFSDGSSISAKNQLWDLETGMVLSTQTESYDGYTYDFKFPAYWHYPMMGGAYQSILHSITTNVTNAVLSNYDGLNPGDEVYVEGLPESRYWVFKRSDEKMILIDKNGLPDPCGVYSNVQLTVLRSAYRNLMDATMSEIKTLKNPLINYLDNTESNNQLLFEEVVAASAAKFKDDWKTPVCGFENSDVKFELNTNFTSELNKILGSDVGTSNLISKMLTVMNTGQNQFFNDDVEMDFDNDIGKENVLNPFYKNYYDHSDEFLGSGSGTERRVMNVSIFREGLSVKLILNNPGNGFTKVFKIRRDCVTQPPFNAAGFQYIPGTNSTPNSILKCELSPYPNLDGAGSEAIMNLTQDNVKVFVETSDGPLTQKTTLQTPVELEYGPKPFEQVNPYVFGIRGIWRPEGYLVFRTDLKQEQVDVKAGGTYTHFTPYYIFDNGKWIQNSTNNDFNRWIEAEKITLYNQNGLSIESVNPIGVHSANLTGYNHGLVVAQAQNARYDDIAFDSFEDFDFYKDLNIGYFPRHFRFRSEANCQDPQYSRNESHTGLSSLELINKASVTLNISSSPSIQSDYEEGYPLNSDSYFGVCKPQKDSTYWVSCWVKKFDGKKPSFNQVLSIGKPTGLNNTISTANTLTLINPQVSEYAIDGWYRLEAQFKVPVTYEKIKFEFKSGIFLDDFRLQPRQSAMKAYVYHPYSLRLMAELDDNNFAKFYEYDAEGLLTRQKQETEKGIKTIQEHRTNIHKKID